MAGKQLEESLPNETCFGVVSPKLNQSSKRKRSDSANFTENSSEIEVSPDTTQNAKNSNFPNAPIAQARCSGRPQSPSQTSSELNPTTKIVSKNFVIKDLDQSNFYLEGNESLKRKVKKLRQNISLLKFTQQITL